MINEITKYYCYRVTVVSKVFQNEANTKEKYYGTKYSTTKIPADVLNVKIYFFNIYLQI